MQHAEHNRNVWDDEPEAGFAGGNEFAGHAPGQAQQGQGSVPHNYEAACVSASACPMHVPSVKYCPLHDGMRGLA